MEKTSKMLKWLMALALSTASVQAQNFSMPPPGGVIVGGFAVVASCAAQSLLTTKPAFGTMDQTGALCVNATVTANATTTYTAASTLPTIGAGAGAAAYESLGGAPYSQPVFGSASGGGTQVDSTHGLPTAIASGADIAEGAVGDVAWVSGNGTVIALLKAAVGGINGAIPAGTNAIGTIIPYASTYNTVAASQTAQALTGGSGGATGDYLSHCIATPGTTSPGVVTILDNSTSIVAFAGGASSVSNLVPFTIPVGAKSTSGAWKVTTGANVTVVCVGKFT